MAKYWKIILPSDHTAYKLLSLQPVWSDVWIKSTQKLPQQFLINSDVLQSSHWTSTFKFWLLLWENLPPRTFKIAQSGHTGCNQMPIFSLSKELESRAIKAAESGSLAEAVKLFNEAVAVAPDRPAVYNNRAQVRQAH